MSYTPTNWQNGDVITAEKLNKLENGVANAGGGANGGLVLDITLDFDALPVSGIGESYSDIETRAENGEFLFIRMFDSEGVEFDLLYLSGVHSGVTFANSDGIFTLYSDTCEWNLTSYDYTYNPTTKEYTFSNE